MKTNEPQFPNLETIEAYEAAVEEDYRKLKEALSVLRSHTGMLPTKQQSRATNHGKGITQGIRDVLPSLPQNFTLNDLCAKLPFKRDQISMAVVSLRKMGELKVLREGRGQQAAIYGKV